MGLKFVRQNFILKLNIKYFFNLSSGNGIVRLPYSCFLYLQCLISFSCIVIIFMEHYALSKCLGGEIVDMGDSKSCVKRVEMAKWYNSNGYNFTIYVRRL